MSVTLADIASRLGVDRSTVSLALNDKTAGKLSPARVEQVRRMAVELGYRPNLAARQLSRGKTRCIGVVMNYLEYYPYSQYFYAISEYCSDRGYHAVPLPMKHRDGRSQDQLELVENTAVDGLIVLEYTAATERYFRQRSSPDYPVVFRVTDPTPHAVDRHHHVRVDYARAVRDMLCQVIARGWERLLLVVERDPGRPNPFVDEHGLMPYEAAGIAEAVRETGIELAIPEQILYCDQRWAIARYQALTRYLASHTLQPGTCLVHCGADGVSGTYSALARAGLRVGVDVAVAATNATPAWEYVLPPVSSCYELHERNSHWLVDTVLDLVGSRPAAAQAPYADAAPYRVALTDSTPVRHR